MTAETPDSRPDPDALLANLHREQRGHLKIFLGAAPGVGKTWEMLAAANQKRDAGVDVVAGLIETHGRAGTIDEIGGLELLPRLQVPYRGQVLEEFDLDAALARQPALLLIDELAHTNATGLRHEKRWQDVKEILDAGGIDVWTTMNVQHLESLNDPVARITGVRVAETIPDTVLDLADEIELIDLPPAELRARLTEGKIYRRDVAGRALEGFFREGNLGALREMALRRVAQHVDRNVASYMRARAIPGPWPAAERVLALIGADPAANNVVRHAARLGDALRAPVTALHIERPDDGTAVQAALDLMLQLGGAVETLTAPGVVAPVLEYAARHNITHIVIGRGKNRWRRGLGDVLARRALAYTLHYVPVPAAAVARPKARRASLAWQPYAVTGAVLAAVTGLGTVFRPYIPQEAMGLVFTALIAGSASRYGRNPGLAAAISSFLVWNFCFLSPLYTFSISDPRDIVAALVFLIVGILTGTLAGRVRAEAQTANARIEALRRISLFGQKLSRAASSADVLRAAAEEAAGVTAAGVVMVAEAGALRLGAAAPPATVLDEAAHAAADWCFRNNIETGIGTGTLPSVPWRFMPLRAAGKPVGVLGTRPNGVPTEPLAQTITALGDQAAMALESVRMTVGAAQTQAREDSQKLRTALLSSLSHDLRTPLTAIRGAAETLASAGEALDAATRQDLLASIAQDTARMTRFLANITEMARVETGEINARCERLELGEIVEAAIARVAGAAYAGVNIAADAAHVQADAALLEQVLVNILDNAVKYAPEGSRIGISAGRDARQMRIDGGTVAIEESVYLGGGAPRPSRQIVVSVATPDSQTKAADAETRVVRWAISRAEA